MSLGDLAAKDRLSTPVSDQHLVGAWDLLSETSFSIPLVKSVSGGIMTPEAWAAISRSAPSEAQRQALASQLLGNSAIATMLGATSPSQAEKEAAAAAMGVPALATTQYPYSSDGVVSVVRGATDAASGTNLATAYAAAKLLTPGGAALSATNRACVLIPPGGYALTATLDLDTDFVDLVAMCPEMGGDRLPADDDTTPGSYYRPPRTQVYAELEDDIVVDQAARDVRMVGFAITNTSTAGTATSALHCSLDDATANDRSLYEKMYFYCYSPRTPAGGTGSAVSFAKHADGTWRDCIANFGSWNCGDNGEFRANMYDCQCGAYGVCGDKTGVSFTTCHLERIRAIGVGPNMSTSGEGAFGGCTNFGAASTSDSYFVDCEAGPKSFCLGKTCAGTFIRCRAGSSSFGATASASYLGVFSGYAEDCVAGADSFGGYINAFGTKGELTGELLRCTLTGDTKTRFTKGATIRGSRITNVTTGIDCLTLCGDGTTIVDSELIVLQGGTGIPLSANTGSITAFADAGGGQVTVTSAGHRLTNGDSVTIAGSTNYNGTFTVANVTADTFEITDTWVADDAAGTWVVNPTVAVAHCRMNNSSNDADGLDATLTNSIGTPNNVVDDQIV